MSPPSLGAVAGGDPRVCEAALELLRAGGNAFDAAVAAGFASALCELLRWLSCGHVAVDRWWFMWMVAHNELKLTQREQQLPEAEAKLAAMRRELGRAVRGRRAPAAPVPTARLRVSCRVTDHGPWHASL